jgi:hypothetical protein
MLTVRNRGYKISLALNKKSAQKQKRTSNNGFSQAVVPSETNTKTLINKHLQTSLTALPETAGLF